MSAIPVEVVSEASGPATPVVITGIQDGVSFLSPAGISSTAAQIDAAARAARTFSRSVPVIWSSSFDTKWNGEASKIVVAEDTTNVVSSAAQDGSSLPVLKAMKLTSDGSADEHRIDVAVNPTLDLSQATCGRGVRGVIRFYLDAAAAANVTNIWLTLCSDTLKARRWFLWKQGTAYADGMHGAGWWTVEFEIERASNLPWSQEPDLAAINRMRLSFITNTTDVTSITFDYLAFFKKPPYALYCLTIDDGFSSAVNGALAVANLLNAATLTDTIKYPHGHMVGTFYTISPRIGTEGYLSGDQLRAMQAQGHLIANHTAGDANWRTLSSIDDRKLTLKLCAQRLADEGLSGGAKILATPGGGVWADDLTMMPGHVRQIRSAFQRRQSPIGEAPYTDGDFGCEAGFDPRIIQPSIMPGVAYCNDAKLSAAFQHFLQVGGIFCLYDHGLVAHYSLATHLAEVQAAANAGLCEVVTMDRLLALQAELAG